jgi:hypothetical protein
VPTINTRSSSISRVAALHADPPPSATPVGSKIRDVRHQVTSAGSSSPEPNVAGFLATAGATRRESAELPALQPNGKSPRPSRAADNRPASTALPASDRSPALRTRAALNRGTSPDETEDKLETAKLVDLVFAEDTWLDGQG